MEQIRILAAGLRMVVSFEPDRDEHGNTYVSMNLESLSGGVTLSKLFIHDPENSRWVLWSHQAARVTSQATTLRSLLTKWQHTAGLDVQTCYDRREAIREAASM
jgi:hypothetical protein